MNLKSLSNEELDLNLSGWVKTEKKALNNIISHIAEIDRRKMYLDYAYPSLRAYLEERMGYDGGSAQRRIDAARLSHSVPSVIESLHQGELKLSQVTVFQKTLREVRDMPVSQETKIELIEAIKNKSTYETQVIVAKALNIEIKRQPKITPQADESVRFEISLTKSQWEKLTTMRELLSNTVPTGNWSEVLEYLSDKVISQKIGKKSANLKPATDEYEKQEGATATEASLYQLKKATLKQDRCCQFKTKDGRQCGSKWNLQLDHIQPKWAGGRDVQENLRVLCANHNRYIYRKQASIRIV